MTLVLTQSPQYPIPGRRLRITFTPSVGANFVRIWLSDAPNGSGLKRQLDETLSSQLEVHSGDTSGPWDLTPDVGGKYVFLAQEYALNSANFGGGFRGDPDGYPTETKVGGEQTITVTVGTKLSMRVGVGGDTGRLEFWLWDDTIRPTSVELHGEKTPRITATDSPRARTASLSGSVVTALENLDNQSATAVLGTPTSAATDFVANFNAHIASTSFHFAADSDNTIPQGFALPGSTDGLIKSVQEITRRLRRHMESDDGTGIGATTYHQISSDDRADLENSLIADSPSDLESSIIAFSDAFRAYEAHRQDLDYHTSADTTNTLNALAPLLALHSAFLGVLQSTAPTAPDTENDGVTVLVHGAGMKEE